jgi:menaquinone-9 beta-reductase
MAQVGARVLVIEREKQFVDRVRGEGLSSWGGAEAQWLGLYQTLCDSFAFEKRWMIGMGPDRDLVSTTPQGLPLLTFSHPRMQETLLAAAAQAGAEIRRGVMVRSVVRDHLPSVELESLGRRERLECRLVVGADGRGSNVRRWGNFKVRRDPDRLLFAGVLEGIDPPRSDAFWMTIEPEVGQMALIAPQGRDVARAYLGYRADSDYRVQGGASYARFVDECVRSGVPRDFYAKATIAGPLATFNGADSWVDHAYSNGIALIGDAAATSDPAWGQGMALTLRDVRTLRDALLADQEWDAAGHAYAAGHDQYYSVIHTVEDWLTELFFAKGANAEARRKRVLPLIAEDPSRIPDHIASGPEQPLNEEVRRRFFGEI